MGKVRASYPMQIVAADTLGPLPQSENSMLLMITLLIGKRLSLYQIKRLVRLLA